MNASALVPVRITGDGLLTDAFENSAASTSRIEIILPHDRSVRITGPIDRRYSKSYEPCIGKWRLFLTLSANSTLAITSAAKVERFYALCRF